MGTWRATLECFQKHCGYAWTWQWSGEMSTGLMLSPQPQPQDHLFSPFLSVCPLRPSIPKLSVWLLCLNSFLGLLISPDLCLVTEGIIPASSCNLWQVLLLQLPSLLAWDLQVVKRQKKSAGLLIWYSKGRDCEASLSRLPFLVNRQQPCTPVQSLCKTDDKLPF